MKILFKSQRFGGGDGEILPSKPHRTTTHMALAAQSSCHLSAQTPAWNRKELTSPTSNC